MVFMQLVEGIKTVRDHTKILKLTKSSETGSACFNPIPPGLFEGGGKCPRPITLKLLMIMK